MSYGLKGEDVLKGGKKIETSQTAQEEDRYSTKPTNSQDVIEEIEKVTSIIENGVPAYNTSSNYTGMQVTESPSGREN